MRGSLLGRFYEYIFILPTLSHRGGSSVFHRHLVAVLQAAIAYLYTSCYRCITYRAVTAISDAITRPQTNRLERYRTTRQKKGHCIDTKFSRRVSLFDLCPQYFRLSFVAISDDHPNVLSPSRMNDNNTKVCRDSIYIICFVLLYFYYSKMKSDFVRFRCVRYLGLALVAQISYR